MRIVFMGTPDFAARILKALLGTYEVAAAMTQPDRPKGRGQAAATSPVKILALEAGLPVFQPETLRDIDARRQLRAYKAELFVVAAYGLILSQRVLDMPPLGCINVHASLLPKYRGAAPIQYALLNGETETGITVMYMDKGIDTGDMLLRRTLPIEPGERFTSLHDRMADLGSQCILDALTQINTGTAKRVPQDSGAATFAPMIAKTDGHLNWWETSAQIINRLRALDPWPGLYTSYEGQTLKVWDCEIAEDVLPGPKLSSQPGMVLVVDAKNGLLVKTRDGALWLTEVQSGGGKRMKTADYLRGHTVLVGTVLS